VVLISIGFLLFFAGQPGTPLFYVTILITLWANRWNWKFLGITRPNWPKTIFKAILFSVCLFILSDFVVTPLLELYLDKIDLGVADHIEGNLNHYLLYLLLGWIIGGFCEEIIFRGYVVKRLAIIFGDTDKAWFISAFIASIGFGFMHYYQGPLGIISAGFGGFMIGLIFIYNRNNLMLPILIHGIYNMIQITLIYLGKARMITDWVHGFIN